MTRAQRTVGILLVGMSILLGGCALGAGGGRPVLGLGGEHLDASDPVERGRALVLTGQYGLAIDQLSQVTTRDPGNARALTLLAVAYGQLKRFDLADRYHAAALEIDPGSAVALNNWGYSYLMRGDDDRAADLLERAMATGGNRPVVAANLALARGNDPAANSSAAAPMPESDPMRSIRVSSHVILVRPAARLRRVAPGVQMLVTTGPADPLQQPPAPAAPVALRPLVQSDGEGAESTDSRFALFRALFALTDDGAQPPAAALVPSQLAALPFAINPSAFGVVSDVDDFTRP